MNIVAIGGGSLKKKRTLSLDRSIVKLTGKKSPRALFIPTASNDEQEYCEAFDRVYGNMLGCRTDHLLLYRRPEDRAAAAMKIRSADLIYVGGGNTLRMMKMWRSLGIDKMLVKAGHQGTVLAGLSAGAICWHEWGHSDSRSYSGKKNWSYIKVRSLGLRPGLYCPHLDSEKRHSSFKKMVAREKMIGIACDNFAAIHYDDSGATCVTARRKARVRIYTSVNGHVTIKSYKKGRRSSCKAVTWAHESMQTPETDFQKLYREHYAAIIRYLRRIVGDADAEDVAQEVFFKVSRSLGDFRGDAKLSTWIYRIATNAAMDHLRRRSHVRVQPAQADPSDDIDDALLDENISLPDTLLIRKDMNDCIRGIVDSLPMDYRTALVLSDLEGMTNAEICNVLDLSMDTVKIRLHRARKRLRAELEKSCHFYRDERNELACDRKKPSLKFLKK